MKQEKIQDFDLNPIAEDWFVEQFEQFVQGDEKRVAHFRFDVKAYTAFVITHVYEYQYNRQWGTVTSNTANIVNYDARSIRKFRKRTL